MATKTVSTANYDPRMAAYDTTEANLQAKMESSPAYFGPGGTPSRSDLATQINLKKISDAQAALESQKLSEQWYGAGNISGTNVEQPKQGVVSWLMNALSRPLYAEVGAAKYFTGKADNQGLFEAMDQNMNQNRETYGGFLREFNVPTPVSMPLGLAMDIALDPINIIPALSGETTGLIGRTLEGARAGWAGKAGVEAAKVAPEAAVAGWDAVKSSAQAAAATGDVNEAAKAVTGVTDLSRYQNWAYRAAEQGGPIGALGGAAYGAQLAMREGLGKVIQMIPGLGEASPLKNIENLGKTLLDGNDELQKIAVTAGADSKEYLEAVKNLIEELKATKGGAEKINLLAQRAGAEGLTGKMFKYNVGKKLAFEELTGRTIQNYLYKTSNRLRLGDRVAQMMEATPGLDKAYNYYKDWWKLSNENWTTVAKYKDEIVQSLKSQGLYLSAARDKATGQLVHPFPEQLFELASITGTQLRELIDTIAKADPQKALELEQKIGQNAAAFLRESALTMGDPNRLDTTLANIVKEGLNTAQTGQLANIDTTSNNIVKMMVEADKENKLNYFTQAMKELKDQTVGGKTPAGQSLLRKIRGEMLGEDQKTFSDILRSSIKSNPDSLMNKKIGKQTFGDYVYNAMNSYEKLISLFKFSKISPLSPASMSYMTVGNIAMAHMAGLDITNPNYYKSIKAAWDFVSGKDVTTLPEMLNTPEMRDFIEKYPTYFSKTLGFSPLTLDSGQWLRDSINIGIEKKIAADIKEEPLLQAEMQRQIEDVLAKHVALRKSLTQTTPTKWWELNKGAGLPTNFATAELTGPASQQLMKDVERNIAKGGIVGKAAQALKWGLDQNKLYQQGDQVFRLGNFLNMTYYGIGEDSLSKLSRITRIKEGDIGATAEQVATGMTINRYSRGGQFYYRVSPDKALEVSNEIYMNYAAMPAGVRILRSLPIVGSPFFSFQYAMLQKTAKALAENPASFNKLTFLLNELQGDKSPLEKAGLQSDLYKWYQNPGMISLSAIPFFKENPVYLNAAQMLPQLSMSFDKPESGTAAGLTGQVQSLINRVPLMKDPVGQLMMDYYITPTLLGLWGEKGIAQNQFGGQLYPVDAPAWQRYGAYPLRTLAETFVPSSVGAAAGMALPLVGQEQAIDLLPSYMGRKVGYASLGKTPVGVSGKEPKLSRWGRSIGSLFGISLNPMDFNYLSTQVNKK